jgi:hypothetical protein
MFSTISDGAGAVRPLAEALCIQPFLEAAGGIEPPYGALQAKNGGSLGVAGDRKLQVRGHVGSGPSVLVQGSRGIHAA